MSSLSFVNIRDLGYTQKPLTRETRCLKCLTKTLLFARDLVSVSSSERWVLDRLYNGGLCQTEGAGKTPAEKLEGNSKYSIHSGNNSYLGNIGTYLPNGRESNLAGVQKKSSQGKMLLNRIFFIQFIELT